MENKNEQKEQTVQEVDLLDVLLDQDNREPIVFMDENGKQITFEQVAVIPYEVRNEKRLYCILKPADHIDGIGDDEAIVFLVDTDKDGNSIIRIEEDEEVAINVFDKYYDLLEEAQKEAKTAEKAKKTAAKKTTAKTTKTAKEATKTAPKATKTAGKTTKTTTTKTASKTTKK